MTQQTRPYGPTEAVAEALDDAAQTEIIGKERVEPKDLAPAFLTALKARGYVVTEPYDPD